MKTIGEQIRDGREAKGLSVEEVSKATLINLNYIKDIENNDFEKFAGDETYVKMYIKKISDFLDLDGQALAEEYLSLTQQFKLEKQEEELAKKEEEAQKSESFVKKISAGMKEVKHEKPQLRQKKVYEDHMIKRIIKYAVVALIILAVVGIAYYGISISKSKDDSTYTIPDNTQVEGEIGTNTPSDADNEDDTKKQNTSTELTIEKSEDDDNTFNVTVPSGVEEIKFKVEFGHNTWVTFNVNGKAYSDFTSATYNPSSTPEKEVTIPVEDLEKIYIRFGCNKGHKLYLNDQELAFESNDSSPVTVLINFTSEE